MSEIMRVAVTADWHGNLPDVPECDLLVIAGDVLPNYPGHGNAAERHAQWQWCRCYLAPHLCRQPCKQWLLTAGNHDWLFEQDQPVSGTLIDAGETVDGLRVWGMPWTPPFMDWAFMASEDAIGQKLTGVSCDVLISHGPPAGPLGVTTAGVSAGSMALLAAIERMQPRLVVCGHIHEGFGEQTIGRTRVINASLVDVHYRPVNPINVIELPVMAEVADE